MREKAINCLEVFLLVSIAALLFFQQEWLILLTFCILVIVLIIHIKDNRRKISHDLSEISEMLEQILQEKQIQYNCINSDTLFDKIRMQILRINEINKGNRNTLEKERDSIKQLLAEISHQLRTPLANMETYLALVDDERTPQSEKKKYIQSVESAEQKIKFLVEKFIIAARMENRIIQIHKFSQDLKQTVAEAVFQVYKRAEDKHIFIEIKDNNKFDYIVPHDRNWICEGVYNLLDNSIKYSPKGSRVQIFLEDNEMFTEISVEDEGIGIDPGEENKIFQLYYRGNNISGQEGYGMGMFITRQIISAHDGFMRVKRKKKGLKVSIFLPKVGT